MKKPKHTPGPWIAFDMGNGMRVTPASVEEDLIPHFSATQNEIAHLKPTAGREGPFDEELWAEQKANAHLIAAAPQMLELLNKIAELIEQDANGGQDYDSHVYASGILTEVERVLAKVRGET